MKKSHILPAALALVLGATAAGTAAHAQAPAPSNQAPAATAPQQAQPQQTRNRDRNQARRGDQRRGDFAARAEARIAYVKAALKITPAQQAAFDHYAQVIRDNAAATQKSFEDMRNRRGQNNDQTTSAIDRIEQRAKMAQMRDQQQQAYLAAFRPLYESLSADQKKVADDLATPRFGHGFHGRGAPRRG